jgi:hypothetical protein
MRSCFLLSAAIFFHTLSGFGTLTGFKKRIFTSIRARAFGIKMKFRFLNEVNDY